MEEFAYELKKLRGKLSLREMAKRTKLSHPYLSQLEHVYDHTNNKVRRPSPDAIRKIANAFNVSYIDLMVKVGHLTADDIAEIKNYDK